MNLTVQRLLQELEAGEQDMKTSHLLDIFDYIYYPYPHEDGYADVVQRLIVLLSKETDPEARKVLVKSIERAYMISRDLDAIDFEPLTANLEGADPFLIRSVLYLLSMTFKKKYIPFIEKYLNHSVQEIREEAKYILDTW